MADPLITGQLPETDYLAFPFRMTGTGGRTSDRPAHIREQIAQVLYTDPLERVFRPDFGAGIRRLIFEPNAEALWELTRKRLQTSLADVLRGEVDSRTIEIEVSGEAEKMLIRIAYTLAAVNHAESHEFAVGSGSGGGV